MDFSTSAELFAQFLSRVPWNGLHASRPMQEQKRVAITIGPYLFTQVPWFNAVLGLLYLKRGWDVSFVVDDLLFGDKAEFEFQCGVIKPVIDLLARRFQIIRLSEQGDAQISDQIDHPQLERLALLNAIWRKQSTEPSAALNQLTEEYRGTFSRTLRKVRTAFDATKADHWVVPHGIFGNSCIFAWEGSVRGIRVATYDAALGSVIVGSDDVAGYQSDIPKVFERRLFFSNDDLRRRCIQFARDERKLRVLGTDKNRSQLLSYRDDQQSRKFDIVMPLNVDYDSAALGKHRLFDNSFEWTIETVKHVLQNTNASIAVRQHPAERFENVQRDLAAIAQTIGQHPRFHFFSATDLVNSYQLIDRSSLVLPMTSTIGVEAAMTGKRIILESSAYYSQLTFAERATSKQNYFDLISLAANDPNSQPQTQQQIEEAELCFFLICVNQIFTTFTPMPDDFENWVKNDLHEIAVDPATEDIMDSLEKDVPACLLRAQRLLGDQS